MKRFFKWIYKPSGNCPVQAEGYFLNYYFYFRARHQHATIEFYKNKADFETMQYNYKFYLKKTSEYMAGWLSKAECTFLVFKGCFLFLFKSKQTQS